MKDEYTSEILARADALRCSEAALRALEAPPSMLWRWAAALAAALMALYPSVSAAANLI